MLGEMSISYFFNLPQHFENSLKRVEEISHFAFLDLWPYKCFVDHLKFPPLKKFDQ